MIELPALLSFFLLIARWQFSELSSFAFGSALDQRAPPAKLVPWLRRLFDELVKNRFPALSSFPVDSVYTEVWELLFKAFTGT